jgi:hypothetical protein
MRKARTLLPAAILALMVLYSCTNKSATTPAGERRATVVMRDGTRVPGAVVSSSPVEVTLAGDDKITRTIPMDQVKSIEYGEAVEAQTQAQAPVEAPLRTESLPVSPAPVSPAAEPVAQTYELPAGSRITIRTNEPIDSATAVEGHSYDVAVSKTLRDAAGAVAIPRGSPAELVIVSASRGGRIRGASDLVLDLRSVTIRGRRYRLDAANIEQRGKSGVGANRRTATHTGGGAALGAIIGAIAGGGRGAAIGAGAGAGAGALTQIVTKGGSIRVPAESLLTFRLDRPLRVVAAN